MPSVVLTKQNHSSSILIPPGSDFYFSGAVACSQPSLHGENIKPADRFSVPPKTEFEIVSHIPTKLKIESDPGETFRLIFPNLFRWPTSRLIKVGYHLFGGPRIGRIFSWSNEILFKSRLPFYSSQQITKFRTGQVLLTCRFFFTKYFFTISQLSRETQHDFVHRLGSFKAANLCLGPSYSNSILFLSWH